MRLAQSDQTNQPGLVREPKNSLRRSLIGNPVRAMPELMNIYDANTQLSRLIDRAASAGEEILISRAGRPLVRLVPVETAGPRKPGLLKGLAVPDALFDSLPEDELRRWE
jgi:prevent-host-death family protein